MKFGQLLSKIENLMVNSYVNESLKKEMSTFKKLVLENKNLSSLYYLYTELSKNHGFDSETSQIFLEESLKQIEKNLSNANTKKIESWVKEIVCENQYQDIDNMVYSRPNTILESVKSKKQILQNLSQKTQVKESINLPLETILRVANTQLESYIDTLDENSKSQLSKVLMTEDNQLSVEFQDLKSKTVNVLSGMSSEDDLTQKKLKETIEQVQNDDYSKINYVRLYNLYNNLI